MKVTILSGVSGSGKSRYSAALAGTIDSADKFFETSEGYRFNPEKLGEAHAQCLRNYVEAILSNTQTIIVDNTNTTNEELAPYVQLALAYGYVVEIVTIMCGPTDLNRAAQRNRHGVPLYAIEKMHERILRRIPPPHWNVRAGVTYQQVEAIF